MEEPFLDAEEGAILREEVTDEVVMASQVDIEKCKKVRTTKKAAFTRKVNNFKSNVGKSFSKLKKAYEELEVAYSELGKACDEYINLVEGKVIEAEGDHMVDPSKVMS